MKLLFRRLDGTFVAEVGGHPYHVIPGEPLFDEAVQTAEAMGDDLGFELEPEPAPLTIDDYRRAIQAHIDATAGQRGYDSGVTCTSYVGSTNPVWAAEATAFSGWRDAIWAYAYAEVEKVQGGERPQPSVAEIVGELPAMNWPA